MKALLLSRCSGLQSVKIHHPLKSPSVLITDLNKINSEENQKSYEEVKLLHALKDQTLSVCSHTEQQIRVICQNGTNILHQWHQQNKINNENNH